MEAQLCIEDVQVGTPLPALSTVVTPTQMFFFSAATYNGHRIHYDRRWATEVEHHPDIVVQGPLQSALAARAVTDWIGGRGRLVAFSSQNRGVAYPDEELTVSGEVTAVRGEDGEADLELAVRRGDDVLMPSRATVRLPSRDDD